MKRAGPLIAVLGLFLFGQAAQADWSAAKRLTWNSGDSRGPDLVAGACGFLYLVWFDSTPGLAEIYYRRSSDNGATWSTCKRATWTSGWSGYPAIAVDPSDNLHMVWWDSTPEMERFITEEARMGELPGRPAKGSLGLRAHRNIRTWPLIPPGISTLSGMTTHRGTRKSIIKAAWMGAPPGRPAKG